MIIEIPDIETLPFIKAFADNFYKTYHKTGGTSRTITNSEIPHKPGIYLAFDEHYNLLYIGHTEDLFGRMASHKYKKNIYYVKLLIMEKSNSYLAGIEYILIDKYSPKLQDFHKNSK